MEKKIERSEKSMFLYKVMKQMGYPDDFCYQVTFNLNTDWTAGRMLGFLAHYKELGYKDLPMVEVVDEMLAILDDRNRIMQKKELEAVNARWNEWLNREE